MTIAVIDQNHVVICFTNSLFRKGFRQASVNKIEQLVDTILYGFWYFMF